jgi:predicted ester cyclase
MKAHVQEWLNGCPDLTFAIEQQVGEGEHVARQLVMTGRHTGSWAGVPPTNRTVSIRMIAIHRVQGGKIVEDWVLVESLGFFQQLGALPDTPDLITEFAQKVRSRR